MTDQNHNSELCKLLLEIGEHERTVNQNIYKFNAYRKAASSLSTFPSQISSGEEAKQLSGIGPKIASKIDEYVKTGKISLSGAVSVNDESQAITQLTRVEGIGPVFANKLLQEGIKSIDELRKNKSKLNAHQLIGLKYLEEFSKKIPRLEIREIEKRMKKKLKHFDTNLILTICGSYRRGAISSDDIDVLITDLTFTNEQKSGNRLERIINRLKEKHLITDEISLEETKFMGVCQLNNETPHRRIDIRLIPMDQYYFAVLYFTGSNNFNKEMRRHASNEGYILNEYSLRKIGSTGVPGEPLEVKSEEDIFEYINLPYKKPEQRI